MVMGLRMIGDEKIIKCIVKKMYCLMRVKGRKKLKCGDWKVFMKI